MGGKREKPEDIVLKLRQVEVLQGQGKPLADAVRQIGVTVQIQYRWRKEYRGRRIHDPIGRLLDHHIDGFGRLGKRNFESHTKQRECRARRNHSHGQGPGDLFISASLDHRMFHDVGFKYLRVKSYVFRDKNPRNFDAAPLDKAGVACVGSIPRMADSHWKHISSGRPDEELSKVPRSPCIFAPQFISAPINFSDPCAKV